MANRYTIEQIHRPVWKSAPSFKSNSFFNQFAGFTTIASGTATAVVSTTAVRSGTLIFLQERSEATVASGTGIRRFEVQSITNNAAFIIGTNDGVGMGRTTVVQWIVYQGD